MRTKTDGRDSTSWAGTGALGEPVVVAAGDVLALHKQAVRLEQHQPVLGVALNDRARRSIPRPGRRPRRLRTDRELNRPASAAAPPRDGDRGYLAAEVLDLGEVDRQQPLDKFAAA